MESGANNPESVAAASRYGGNSDEPLQDFTESQASTKAPSSDHHLDRFTSLNG